MKTKLADLKLPPRLLQDLVAHGFEYAEDFTDIPSAQALRIPNMNGRSWTKIANAIGRQPYGKP